MLRAPDLPNGGNFLQRNSFAGLIQNRDLSDLCQAVPESFRITHDDRIASPVFKNFRGHRSADCAGDDLLHLANLQSVIRQSIPIDLYIDEVSFSGPFRKGRAGSRNGFQGGLDLLADFLGDLQIGSHHLDGDRCTRTRCQHVGPAADRHRPGVRDAGKRNRAVHLRDQIVVRDPITREPAK